MRDAAHVREVAASISALGFCDPILIGKDNVVLDGEVRVEAAKLLGLPSVPCVRVDHLTDEEQRLLRLAINRLGEKGQWDLDELKIEFEELILDDAPIETDWPGLRTADLYENRDLKPTTDLRAVLKGVLAEQFGLSADVLGRAVFPDTLGVKPMSGLVAV